MKKHRVIIVSVLVLALVLGVLSFAFPLLVIAIPSLTYLLSGARVFVEDLGLPQGARDVSEITVSAADGTAPERAERFFRIAMTEEGVRKFYLDRCSALDMTAPPEESLGHSPEMICAQIATYGVSPRVYLYSDCDETVCEVAIEVRI
ncbi:MAG: hypothetical protein MI785_24055 [Kiloniellales bacterium]|nr:hypothetical protein [Kiloniellales bacterium]